MKQYSLLKGIGKTVNSVALYAIAFVLFIGAVNFQSVLDASVWGLLEQYLKPVLGTLTVGGALVFIQNWLKNR